MRKLAILTAAILAGSAVPALAWVDHPAPTREHHDIWHMKCYPDDGTPFNVTTNDKAGGLVIIYGKNGQARSNTIESTENTDYGFLVIANGFDFKGQASGNRVACIHEWSFASSRQSGYRSYDRLQQRGRRERRLTKREPYGAPFLIDFGGEKC